MVYCWSNDLRLVHLIVRPTLFGERSENTLLVACGDKRGFIDGARAGRA